MIEKEIRQKFFAMRNGLLADTLRKGGMTQKYIFGLQLPQLKQIADEFRPSDAEAAAELGRSLWDDTDCRESRLIACHIFPVSLLSIDEAEGMARGCSTREEADILAFRLLKNTSYAPELADRLDGEYAAEAIRRFL